MNSTPISIEFKEDHLLIIDQRFLPSEKKMVELRTVEEVAEAIEVLAVRGAPLIGITAAYGVYIGVREAKGLSEKAFEDHLFQVIDRLRRTRPTAVNLFWALDRVRSQLNVANEKNPAGIIENIRKEAIQIHHEDRQMCKAMGEYGQTVIQDGDSVLTICNTGALATGGTGTALSVVYHALELKKKIKVYSMETRPLLQGSRLTCWELTEAGADVTLITDNMLGYLLKTKPIRLAISGADRIARNGDTANKIGTSTLAILCDHFGIPFYVAAPSSTFDPRIESGDEIPIEERNPDEVRKIGDRWIAPKEVAVFNPAFDVTPHRYIAGFITDQGIIEPSFRDHFPDVFRW